MINNYPLPFSHIVCMVFGCFVDSCARRVL